LLYSVTLPLHVPSTPATYTLSLHDALPISRVELVGQRLARRDAEAERGGVEATLGLLDGEHRRVEGRDAEEERRPVARDLLEHRLGLRPQRVEHALGPDGHREVAGVAEPVREEELRGREH